MAKRRKFGHKKQRRKDNSPSGAKRRSQGAAERAEQNGARIDDLEREAVARSRGRGDSGKLLTDPHRIRSDEQLVNKAVRGRWNVRRKNMIRRRLEGIVDKKTADVLCKGGEIVTMEAPADKLAIEASRVLVAMNAQDQVDDLKGGETPPAPTPVEVNVHVAVDNRRIELARLAHKLGARSLLIDGRQVLVADILGPAGLVPEGGEDLGENESDSRQVLPS